MVCCPNSQILYSKIFSLFLNFIKFKSSKYFLLITHSKPDNIGTGLPKYTIFSNGRLLIIGWIQENGFNKYF